MCGDLVPIGGVGADSVISLFFQLIKSELTAASGQPRSHQDFGTRLDSI